MMALSVSLLEELAGEMDRPSDKKKRISGYGDRTWTRKADREVKGHILFRHDAASFYLF
jgi:hypothetical protein